ncbi:MAG TPA: hypothetical protein VEQ66_09355 [Propionibacteriaceae bacterium]|nr:hypothetical protein [Propionibacteriaceae bacterium]
MTFTPIEELAVAYDPSELERKVWRRRRLVRSRLVSLVITAVLLVALYAWRREDFTRGYLILCAVFVGLSVALLVGAVVAHRRARRELARMGQGTALRIGRTGVELAGSFVPWSEVAAMRAVTGRWGRHERLQLTRTGGEPLEVPLNQMSVRPATLDLTARAYSAGRHGVDLAALDA